MTSPFSPKRNGATKFSKFDKIDTTKSSEELRNRLGISNICDIMRQSRLRWFGHVERMENENPVSKCRVIEVDGARGRGRPCKTWTQLIRNDLRHLRLESGLAQDREAWRRAIKKTPSKTHASMEMDVKHR